MQNPKRYLITAALPYANGLKHVGHLAGAYIPADIYARYLRAQLRDVVFVCGSDEHGTAIPIQARKEGTTAQAIIDKYHEAMRQDFGDLSITAPAIRCITKQRLHFFSNSNRRANWKQKRRNNSSIPKHKLFWPIVLLKAPALPVKVIGLLVTNVKVADVHSVRMN
jgi:hypothetical protein